MPRRKTEKEILEEQEHHIQREHKHHQDLWKNNQFLTKKAFIHS
jgi:hypothetical protein